MLFLYFFYGILGTQMYMGIMRQKCFFDSDGSLVDKDINVEVCGLDDSAGLTKCGPGQTCSYMDPVTGKANLNPYHNFISFDNVLISSLTIQVLTLTLTLTLNLALTFNLTLTLNRTCL